MMKKPEKKPKVEMAAMRGGAPDAKKKESRADRQADAVVARLSKGKRPK